MSNRNIQIGQLKIRLPHSAAGSARQIASGLGRAILRGVAEATRGHHGAMRITEVSVGKITAMGGSESLQKQIARRVTAEVMKRFNQEGAQ